MAHEQHNNSHRVKLIDKDTIILFIRIIISAIILSISFFTLGINNPTQFSYQWWIMLSLYLIAYLIVAYDYLFETINHFIHLKDIFDESTLMIVASLGAIIIGEYPEGVLVILLAQIGEALEEISIHHSHNLVVNAIDMRPKTANKISNNKIATVDSTSLEIGDEIIIKVGEVIPTDGKVIKGTGEIDTSSLTGEFVPVAVNETDEVHSGTILVSGSLILSVTHSYEDSTTSKILNMVIESGEHKSKPEKFITKFAKYYTPIVVLIAFLLAVVPPIIECSITSVWSMDVWNTYIYHALTLLVISCPCAVIISVPLTYLTGVALASKYGIIVKGANYLDRINDISVLLTDKTGTLTTGEFSIIEKHPMNISQELFDYYIVSTESRSTHPIGKAICKSLKDVEISKKLGFYKEKAGFGIENEIDDKIILLGNEMLLNKHKIVFEPINSDFLVLYLVVDNIYCGYILLDDSPKENAKKTISLLEKSGVEVVMLTGGKASSAQYISKQLGIYRYYSDLLPVDKINYLKEELATKEKNKAIAFVGDGVNDAPSIILSDVGFAMGGLGSDMSITNADVVIMNDDPLKIVVAQKIAKASRQRVISLITFILLIKLVILILALPWVNIANMWIGVLADTGLTLVAILLALSFFLKKIKV